MYKKTFSYISITFMIVVATLLNGCASPLKVMPLAADERVAVAKSGTITVAVQQTPGFMFNTPAGAVSDSFIWNTGKDRWSSLMKAHKIPDFTRSLAQQFTHIMKKRAPYQFAIATTTEPLEQESDFERLHRKYRDDYILEFKTQGGVLIYKPLAWDTYNMGYAARAYLVRRRDKQVVWEGYCEIGDNPVMTIPGDDFLKGDGKLLRKAAAYATGACAKQIADHFMLKSSS